MKWLVLAMLLLAATLAASWLVTERRRRRAAALERPAESEDEVQQAQVWADELELRAREQRQRTERSRPDQT